MNDVAPATLFLIVVYAPAVETALRRDELARQIQSDHKERPEEQQAAERPTTPSIR